MKQQLILAMQRAIVLYVKHKEGKQYKGKNDYSLTYIESSKHIPKHRKTDLKAVDNFFNDTTIETDVDLALKVFTYLEKVKTGFLLFWIFQVGHDSRMRDGLHHTIFLHDPALLTACQQGKVEQYKATAEAAEKTAEAAPGTAASTPDSLSHLYLRVKRKEKKLESQLVVLRKKITELEQKNVVLQDSLNNQIFVNTALKRKVNLLANKKPPVLAVKLSPRNEDPKSSNPSPLSTPRRVMAASPT